MLSELSTLFARLRQEQETVRALVEDAPEGALDRPGPGTSAEVGWSAREMLAHIVSSEHGMLALARAIVSGHGDAVPASYDVHAENAKSVARRSGVPAVDLLREWDHGRAEWGSFLETVTPAQLEMSGHHPASAQPMSLRTVVIVMLRHDRGHRVEMASLLKGG